MIIGPVTKGGVERVCQHKSKFQKIFENENGNDLTYAAPKNIPTLLQHFPDLGFSNYFRWKDMLGT